MSRFPTLAMAAIILLSVFAAACSGSEESLPFYHDASFTPRWKGESSFSTDTLHTIAPFSFTDQDGNTITNDTFKGKIYVANFFFTICPGICPKMTANLERVAERWKEDSDVLFLSHSVTPHIDSVSQLKKYADEHHIRSSQWHLVTGDKDQIYTLARQSYFAEQEIGIRLSTNEFLHTEHFILVDRQGHIRGIYKGTLELEAQRLAEDLAILRKE